VSYELKENLMIDLTMLRRTYEIPSLNTQSNTTMFTAGIRLNMFKRNYDF
jgi:hypothetical protein